MLIIIFPFYLSFLKCAILSPAFKVREFSVTDAVPFPISLVWSHDSEDTEGYVSKKNFQIMCFTMKKKKSQMTLMVECLINVAGTF